jgi:hypothetical protein
MRVLGRLIRLIPVLAVLPVAAQEIDVPEALLPWRNWVLYGEEFRACPVRNGEQPQQAASHLCAWPGSLRMDVGPAGAEFSQAWTLYADDWVPLPGNAEYWPGGVTVDGNAQAVVTRGGRAMLRLTRGTHRVAGELAWATRPASITIPAETGLVALTLNGQTVANPEIDGGTLWLGLRPDADVEEDRLDVIVHRRLRDTLPMRLETIVRLDVAGQSREVMLEGAGVTGFVGEALQSDLPVELTPDGILRVQIRPGSWQVTLRARSPAPVAMLARAAVVDPWPADEIWSFAAEPRFRVAALEGAEPVDAERSGVPFEWQQLPSYRVAAEQALTIVERSRNDAAQANRLSLRRDLWLDFDGGGFTARDVVTGRMSSAWRLDMAAPYTMTMAAIGDENLLVTQGVEPGVQGVELRAQAVSLTDTSRVARLTSLPVTGYRETFDDATTTLHVPPGFRLVAAPGADQARGAWLERWSLLDIFLVLIITAATWRLFGPGAGSVALIALVIAFHEPGAPRWAWLNLLVAIALLTVAPEGRLRTFCRRYQWVSLAALVLLLIPFTVTQLRTAVYPQLELAALGRGIASSPARNFEFLNTLPAAPGVAGVAQERAREAVLDEIRVTGGRIGGLLSRYQPGALVQTGPGLPDWIWTQYSLGFAGPVEAGQTMRLVMLGPWLVGAWRIASVALALGLLWVLAGRPTRLPAKLVRGGTAASALVLAALAVLGLATPQPSHAQAATEFPSPALLEELKSRLTSAAPCHPACAELSAAEVEVAGDDLTIELELAVQAPVAVPVPSVLRGWRPTSITVDGAGAGFLFRDPARTAWLSLAAGVHRVVLRGPLPAGDSVSLPFPLPPRRIAVTASGWDVTGLSGGRLPSGTLELTRERSEAGDDTEIGGTVFPPFVTVVRRVEFDIDWQVTTSITRVAPETGAFTLPIDLLPNEAVLTPGIEVAAGRATVAFAAGEQSVAWESRLPTAETLTLTAPASAPWSESWQFAVGHIWHADYGGIPATAPEFPDPSFYVPEYYPRPGEMLTVTLRRPEPASGDTIAIDTVDYFRDVGARASESTLGLTYRSTRGTEHVITLPEGSELESVAIDGDDVPLELDGNTLGLPVTPGAHDAEIVWRNAGGSALRTRVPAVDLGGGASNIRTMLSLPADRWVLFTFGPRLGPAVLYWPELLALVIAAFALGRLAWSPLSTYEWLLLGFGLSTFAWPVLALFAVWAFAMSWRARTELVLSNRWFNAVQVALAALAVIALVALIGAIPFGLLGRPDMQIVSPVDYNALSWFADRTAGLTPDSGALSVSLWFYKAAMLAWALWLSFALLRWLPWAWRAFSRGGIWRGRVVTPPA